MEDIISHIRQLSDNKWEIQSNEAHSNGVARLAEEFASEFGMAEWGKVLGLIHDKGKEQKAFQQHIKSASCYEETADIKADHAYVGALLAKKHYPKEWPLLVNEIAGHHRGLYDYLDLMDVLQREIPKDVEDNIVAENLQLPQNISIEVKDFHHFVRLLYSCLVDADYLDTEAFMNKEQSDKRKNTTSLERLMPKLEDFLAKLKENAKNTQVNRIRQQIQDLCIKASEDPIGFYSLTVPTGGGKTLSSLVWAMKHAIKNGKKRIIIAIPYTSIIVQTASILKKIFGEENVLEHHSNVDPDIVKNVELKQKYKLATENWDYPIIVTTNVQLFESMMASKPSKCRKLHNICNSVLILDEVQTIPIEFLQPIVDSLDTYNKVFGTSVLFTTASQPVLTGDYRGTNPNIVFKGIKNIKEIIPREIKLHEKLKRVEFEFDSINSSYDDIAARLSKIDKVLCIVNTRKAAQEIFSRLPKEGITIHLSRMMCPKHVMQKIEEMKNALKDENNKIIRVVTTQLIEAGVDIDFPVVYRQEAGLDSLLQAAGRCNREGKKGICTTYVFNLKKQGPLPPGFMTRTNNARLALGDNHDWFSQETMSSYFEQLYSRADTFDIKNITKSNASEISLLYNLKELKFEEASKEFTLINSETTPIVVQWGDSQELIERLRMEGPSYLLMKQISAYSVNINKKEFINLLQDQLIEEVIEGVWFAPNKSQYSEELGLLFENHWLEETYII